MTKKAEKEKADTGVAVVENAMVISKPLHIAAARIVNDGVEVAEIEGLPAEFQNADTLEGFPPSPKFEKPGDAVFGYFITRREGVGPNSSRLYELSMPQKGAEPITIAVWGSTAIDRLFDSAFPPIKTGDKLGFIYIGEKATKRAKNPVKLFKIKVARADGRGGSVATA